MQILIQQVGVGWSLRLCIANKISGGDAAAGPQTTLLVARARRSLAIAMTHAFQVGFWRHC